MTKQVQIKDFITEEQFEAAFKLYVTAEPGTFARRCATEIIEPILPEINQKLGQENNAKYIAYVLEGAFSQTFGKP